MSIKIGDYNFEGPYDYPDEIIDCLRDNTGVYAILENLEGKYSILDIGESSRVLTTLENHDGTSWTKNSNGTLSVAVFYTSNKQPPGRKEIEQELRGNFNLPCGHK